jgi:hypothetical protein
MIQIFIAYPTGHTPSFLISHPDSVRVLDLVVNYNSVDVPCKEEEPEAVAI